MDGLLWNIELKNFLNQFILYMGGLLSIIELFFKMNLYFIWVDHYGI